MSNRFRPAWLLVLAALSASALAKAPETVNIGYQKANIFALLKYRGTLDESLKKQGIAVRWVEFPAGPQMLEDQRRQYRSGRHRRCAAGLCPGGTSRSGLPCPLPR